MGPALAEMTLLGIRAIFDLDSTMPEIVRLLDVTIEHAMAYAVIVDEAQ